MTELGSLTVTVSEPLFCLRSMTMNTGKPKYWHGIISDILGGVISLAVIGER